MTHHQEKSKDKRTSIRLTETEIAICNYLVDKEGYSNVSEAIRFILRSYFLNKYSYQVLQKKASCDNDMAGS